jgi:hypothetical protein
VLPSGSLDIGITEAGYLLLLAQDPGSGLLGAPLTLRARLERFCEVAVVIAMHGRFQRLDGPFSASRRRRLATPACLPVRELHACKHTRESGADGQQTFERATRLELATSTLARWRTTNCATPALLR